MSDRPCQQSEIASCKTPLGNRLKRQKSVRPTCSTLFDSTTGIAVEESWEHAELSKKWLCVNLCGVTSSIPRSERALESGKFWTSEDLEHLCGELESSSWGLQLQHWLCHDECKLSGLSGDALTSWQHPLLAPVSYVLHFDTNSGRTWLPTSRIDSSKSCWRALCNSKLWPYSMRSGRAL